MTRTPLLFPVPGRDHRTFLQPPLFVMTAQAIYSGYMPPRADRVTQSQRLFEMPLYKKRVVESKSSKQFQRWCKAGASPPG
ncbi:MAG: hypothetical protein EBV16_13410 [Betaproteobacteria bacterium]|nr:hypothetical protein [Betaproteobacteria bacterium]NBQ80101.1 hypothetical protein [Betaproteobacteria bacterium]NBS40893.1 hypothetical protein [Betaproteobacteria bacterium]NBY54384.1 hypothetical protein [Betaproteobacteria bacterium]NCY08319.1 hypothetical protein [Betaproteobacteria bacterium]